MVPNEQESTLPPGRDPAVEESIRVALEIEAPYWLAAHDFDGRLITRGRILGAQNDTLEFCYDRTGCGYWTSDTRPPRLRFGSTIQWEREARPVPIGGAEERAFLQLLRWLAAQDIPTECHEELMAMLYSGRNFSPAGSNWLRAKMTHHESLALGCLALAQRIDQRNKMIEAVGGN